MRIMLVLATVVVAIIVVVPKRVKAVRAFFVFGDSPVDSGNNNYLPTIILNVILGKRIGSEPTLPYMSPELNGQKLLVGANFASAGIGILNDTGIQFVGIIRMFQQFELFEQYQQRLSAVIGAKRTKKVVNEALVLMTLGGNTCGNDFVITPRSRQFTVPDFSRYLISQYRRILMRLYELGARRVLVTGTGPLGCVPSQLAMRSSNGECLAELQQATQIFNPLLDNMTKDLNSQLGAHTFVSVNAFLMNIDFITNPQKYGFVTSKMASCGQGPYNGLGPCNPLSDLCQNRYAYAFWDAFHPSQRALEFIVDEIFKGTSNLMSPINLSTIMVLDSNI
ncbi:GDSL esterase/lipase At4g28780-like [Glycine soja]|uniref:GDSL esterase/lipase At4g28780-like n=1 Tax=Glycine soja TaxID=3848 RepID=UPI00103E4CDE|nr:GDSL esterase/lipase At4g28780-like [Glycine soja]